MLLDLTGHQRGRADGGEVVPSSASASPRGALLLGVHLRLVGVVVDVIVVLCGDKSLFVLGIRLWSLMITKAVFYESIS